VVRDTTLTSKTRTRKISHPLYLCQISKKRLSRDANHSTARRWAVLALELVSDPSVTTSPDMRVCQFVFDATKEILLLHILVVCLIFYQPIVQSQLSVALGLQATEAPSVNVWRRPVAGLEFGTGSNLIGKYFAIQSPPLLKPCSSSLHMFIVSNSTHSTSRS